MTPAGYRAQGAAVGLVAFVIGFALPSCGKKEADERNMPKSDTSWQYIDRTSVDDHGVVCYYRSGGALSCIKVKP